MDDRDFWEDWWSGLRWGAGVAVGFALTYILARLLLTVLVG